MTLRESYIQGIIAALRALPDFPASVERAVTTAFARNEGPVLVVHRGAEGLEGKLGEVHRTCEVLVSVVTRSSVPDQLADEIMELAHPVVMAFRGTGMIEIAEEGTNAPTFAQADAQACLLTTRYGIKYATSRRSLSA